MDNKKTKDSGIEWIGEIPKDWEEIRLKELFNKKQGGAWGEEAKEDENDRVCIRVADFDFERQTIKEGLKTVRNYSKDNICKLQMQGNELLIEKSGGGEKTPVGRSILSNGLEGYLYANFIDKLPIKSTNHPKYIAYYMKTLYQNNIVMPYIKQTTGIQNLDVEALLFEIISVPKYIIQHQIADFLDKKCSQIDELIANNQSQIDKLKEYKQSVITQAVTKGLDPNVETKDSGIDWIGQIPKNWEVISLKALFNFGKGLPITKADLIPNGVKVISYGQIHAKYNNIVFINDKMIRFVDENYLLSNSNSLVEKNDFIFADTSEDLEGAGDFIFIDKDDTIFAGYHTIVLKHKQNKSNKFLAYLFMSYQWKNQIRSRVTGIKVFSISRGILSKASVILPPEEAQHQIADYLDKKCSQIDSLIEIKQQKIEKLQEYKKSLIYEYVTGKKEVC